MKGIKKLKEKEKGYDRVRERIEKSKIKEVNSPSEEFTSLLLCRKGFGYVRNGTLHKILTDL